MIQLNQVNIEDIERKIYILEDFLKKDQKFMSISRAVFAVHDFFHKNSYSKYKITFHTKSLMFNSINQVSDIEFQKYHHMGEINFINVKIFVNTIEIIGINGILPDSYLEILNNSDKNFNTALRDFLNIFNNRIAEKINNVYTNNDLSMSNLLNKINNKKNYSLLGVSSIASFTRYKENYNLALQNALKCSNIIWHKTKTEHGLKTILENLMQKPVNIFTQQEYTMDINQNDLTRLGINSKIGCNKNSFIGNKFHMKNGIHIQITLKSNEFLKFLPKSYISQYSNHKTLYEDIKEAIKFFIGFEKKIQN
jgi:predicted component of type VI protein secretion system